MGIYPNYRSGYDLTFSFFNHPRQGLEDPYSAVILSQPNDLNLHPEYIEYQLTS